MYISDLAKYVSRLYKQARTMSYSSMSKSSGNTVHHTLVLAGLVDLHAPTGAVFELFWESKRNFVHSTGRLHVGGYDYYTNADFNMHLQTLRECGLPDGWEFVDFVEPVRGGAQSIRRVAQAPKKAAPKKAAPVASSDEAGASVPKKAKTSDDAAMAAILNAARPKRARG
jgi:hypothetical protein